MICPICGPIDVACGHFRETPAIIMTITCPFCQWPVATAESEGIWSHDNLAALCASYTGHLMGCHWDIVEATHQANTGAMTAEQFHTFIQSRLQCSPGCVSHDHHTRH